MSVLSERADWLLALSIIIWRLVNSDKWRPCQLSDGNSIFLLLLPFYLKSSHVNNVGLILQLSR